MTLLDQRRAVQRRERILEQFGSELAGSSETPRPRLDHDRLERCVQNLRERERSLIMMTFYDEETGADVAGFMGLSEANVRVIRHRAIHQLRHCMEGVS